MKQASTTPRPRGRLLARQWQHFIQRIEPEPPADVEVAYLRSLFRSHAVFSPVSLSAVVYLYAQVEVVPEGSGTLAWVIGCVIVHLVRLAAVVLYFRREPKRPAQIRAWVRLATVFHLTDGLLHLWMALGMWTYYGFVEQLILLMTAMLLVTGRSYLLAGRWTAIALSAPMIYLGYFWSAWQVAHVYAHPVAVMVLLFFGLYLLNARAQQVNNVQGLHLARQLEAKNAELKELASARSRLLATVSHDLRQPSHAIGLLCERAQQESDPKALQGLLHDLNELSQSLSASLATLMDLTRLDAGLVRANIAPVSMGQLLLRLEAEYGAAARHKGLVLEVPPSSLWVRSDPALLYGVLANLVANAIKYTRAGRVRVELLQARGELQLSVRDTGPGIRPDKLDLIFKEFMRLEGVEPGSEGLGLGLSIVRRYAQLLGHALEVKSQPGQGSSFSIRLPLAEPGVPPAEMQVPARPRATSDARLAGLRVLLVDNVDLVLSSTVRTLSAWGCQVHAARSLAEARRVAERQPLDLLISDFHLGDEEPHGLTLISTVRALPGRQLAQLPALLMTGDVSGQLEAEARRCEVGILHKPVRPAVLKNRLLGMHLLVPPGPGTHIQGVPP